MNKSTFIRLGLQFFAEGGDTTTQATSVTNAEPTANEPQAQATPQTLNDLLKTNKAFQSEFDKLMSKGQETALAKARAEWEAEAQAKADEAAKLAKMTADEKAKHEREKQEKALLEREKAVARRELTAEAISQLTDKGLPIELASCLNYDNADSCKSSMEAVEKAFNLAVEKVVNEKLRGSAPKSVNGNNEPTINSILGALTYEHNNGGI